MSTERPCPQCGSSVRSEDRFCPGCGASVSGSSASLPSRPAGSLWDQLLERVRAAVAPRYRVERVLGYGGMAGVYLADETRLARSVAIKVMAPELMLDQALVHRFQQEAQTIAQLRHPNIVAVHNIDESDGLHYFVMEYVPGRTLAQVIAGEGGRLPIPAILHWLSQVGSALDYGHRQGIVHRDVKPGNVLLDAEGNALVSDFGIAKASDTPGLTRTGMLVGTPAYISPEYCLTGVVTGASDQYSLGILAFEALTGRPPFTGPTIATLQAHISQPPPSLAEVRADCPPAVQYAVERMLAKKPEDRFADIRAALAAMGAEPAAHDDPLRPALIALVRRAESISIRAVAGPLGVGDSTALTAEVCGPGGAPLHRGAVRWSSASPDVVAVDGAGVLTALGPGEAVVSAECEGVSASLVVEVLPSPIEEIELEPIPGPVAAGTSVRMKARVLTNGGGELKGPISWSTSNPSVAVITRDGWVEARNPGSAVIIASVGDRTAAAVLTVEAPIVARPSAESRPELQWDEPPASTPAPATMEPPALKAGTIDPPALSAAAEEVARAEAVPVKAAGVARGSRPRWPVLTALATAGAIAGGVYLFARGEPRNRARDGTAEVRPITQGFSSPAPVSAAPQEQASGTEPAPAGEAAATQASRPAPPAGEPRGTERLTAGGRPVLTDPASRSSQVGTLTTPEVKVSRPAPTQSPEASVPPSAPPASQSSAGPASGAPPSTTPASPPAPSPERSAAQIRETITGFVRSIEARDVKQIERLYPDASKEWLDQWGPFMTNRRDVRELHAGLVDFGQPEITGESSRVRFTILLEWNDMRNAKQQQRLNMTAALREEGDGWTIRSLQSER